MAPPLSPVPAEDAVPARAARSRARSTAPVPVTFFRDMVVGMRNGVIAITRAGRIATINAEAYRILGIRPAPDDHSRRYDDVLRAAPDVVRILRSAFELTNLPNRAELRLRDSRRVIGYTLSQVRDARGRLTGAALFFKDLTRVEQLEERERLRDRLAALGEMAAAIAHEVKNPLAGIEVMAGLLKRRVPAGPDADLLTDIIKEAKTANAIVLEVLEFVRPIRLQVEPVSLARLLDEAVQLADGQARRGDVQVHVDLPRTLPAIEADAQQLRQLFTNLVTNAFEALGGRGTVRVSAMHVLTPQEPAPDEPICHGAVTITVADDGPGVPAEVRDRIFSPFFTTKPRGSGLGLSIVRKIVDAHEGRIDLDAADHGTTFRIVLPVKGT